MAAGNKRGGKRKGKPVVPRSNPQRPKPRPKPKPKIRKPVPALVARGRAVSLVLPAKHSPKRQPKSNTGKRSSGKKQPRIAAARSTPKVKAGAKPRKGPGAKPAKPAKPSKPPRGKPQAPRKPSAAPTPRRPAPKPVKAPPRRPQPPRKPTAPPPRPPRRKPTPKIPRRGTFLPSGKRWKPPAYDPDKTPPGGWLIVDGKPKQVESREAIKQAHKEALAKIQRELAESERRRAEQFEFINKIDRVQSHIEEAKRKGIRPDSVATRKQQHDKNPEAPFVQGLKFAELIAMIEAMDKREIYSTWMGSPPGVSKAA